MKNVDDVRGYGRTILFNAGEGHRTDNGYPVTNCVVELLENDSCVEGFDHVGGVKTPRINNMGPALSLRFYDKPSSLDYHDDTPIGIDITLGPELAFSLVKQIQEQWPNFVKVVDAFNSESSE